MVGLKCCHIRKHLTQSGEPQRYSWERWRRRKRRISDGGDENGCLMARWKLLLGSWWRWWRQFDNWLRWLFNSCGGDEDISYMVMEIVVWYLIIMMKIVLYLMIMKIVVWYLIVTNNQRHPVIYFHRNWNRKRKRKCAPSQSPTKRTASVAMEMQRSWVSMQMSSVVPFALQNSDFLPHLWPLCLAKCFVLLFMT